MRCVLVIWVGVGGLGFFLYDLGGLRSVNIVCNLNIWNLNVIHVLRGATVGTSLSVLWSRGASWIVHDHLGLKWLINDMCITAWATTYTYVHVSSSLLLTVSRWLLKALTRSSCDLRTLMVRIRHVIVFFLSQQFSAVWSDRPTRCTCYHNTAISCIRTILIVKWIFLFYSQASVYATLANLLIKWSTHMHLHLHLGAIVVHQALWDGFTRSPKIVLIVPAVSAASLRKYGIFHTLVICYLLHELIVLWLVSPCLLNRDIGLLAYFLHTLNRLTCAIISICGVHWLHVLSYYFIFGLLTVV